MKALITTATCLLLAATSSYAQGPRGSRNQNSAHHPLLDLTRLQTLSGAVTEVDIGYGMQYPSITVAGKLIKVAPVWYFLEKNFEIKAGDPVSVVAAPSTADAYLHAIEITNTTTKARIQLRDADGSPLWAGGRGRRGNPEAPRNGGGCIDPASIRTVTGKVEKASMGLGIQMPTLTIKLADGTLVTMKIGPERILQEADFELKAGETVTARYAHATCSDENVALSLTNAAGVTVILRDDDGTPNWN